MQPPPIAPDYVRLLASYGEWMNGSLYAAAATLDDEERRRDRGAFFKSIHATLSHLLWADMNWLNRLAATGEPPATSIRGSLEWEPDFERLRARREVFDRVLTGWAERCTAADLTGSLTYAAVSVNREITGPRWLFVVHLFNHGTHHRGQVHAMLTAAGAKPGDTDLPLTPGALAI